MLFVLSVTDGYSTEKKLGSHEIESQKSLICFSYLLEALWVIETEIEKRIYFLEEKYFKRWKLLLVNILIPSYSYFRIDT